MKSAPDRERQPLEIEPHFVGLRPASESDRAFCYDVKKAAIGPYVAEIWGWDEAFQRQFHCDDYAATRPDIVVFEALTSALLKSPHILIIFIWASFICCHSFSARASARFCWSE